MFLIDSSGNVANQFVDADPSTGDLGTEIAADWLNALQNEIAAVITGLGGTLDKANSGQLSAAIASLFPVITANIAAGAVTRAKLAALGHQVSSSSGNFTTGSGSYVDVTNLTVTITTSGRPVVLRLVPDGDVTHVSQLSASRSNVATGFFIAILRGSTKIYESFVGVQSGSAGTPSSIQLPPSVVQGFDDVVAGTYTYKVQVFALNTGDTVGVAYSKLVAYET